MHESRLIVDLVIAFGAAFAGGFIARAIGLPVLVGYLVAGIAIGPNTPGLVADRESVEVMANLGVAFLMFGLGVEFSLGELLKVRRIAIVGGSLQILTVAVLGAGVGRLIGWEWPASLLLGGAFAISSSIVALKLILSRGEGESPHARVALGVGVVQDLSLVPMIALMPVLSGGDDLLGGLARSIGIAAVALVVVFVLGLRLVPWVLYQVARTESRELFLMTIVLIALGTAIAAEQAGLSLALGAFLAGLVVSESEFDDQVLAEIIPLRDLFATLFFVSVGMLLDPAHLLDKPGVVAVLVASLMIGKLLLMGGSLLAAGADHRTATLASLLMAQMGEFSFVLAGVALGDAVIDDEQYGLILVAALGSILLIPMLQPAGPALTRIAARLPQVRAQERKREGELAPGGEQSSEVVILGYGRVGRVIGDALTLLSIPYAVIEINPATVRTLRMRGVHAIYGDAAADPVLQAAGIAQAKALLITTPDLATATAAIHHAKRLNPRIEVITRATNANEVAVLAEFGADDVVQPEFEAGIESLRHLLHRLGVPAGTAAALVQRGREEFYRPESVTRIPMPREEIG